MTWKTHLFSFRSKVEPDDGGYKGLDGGNDSSHEMIQVTWLPTIEIAGGISPHQAGWHLFLYQIVGIGSALAIPRLMIRPDSQVAACVVASIPMLLGILGLLLAPSWAVVWAIVAGLGSGAALVVALALISLRGRSHRETTQLSGMAQCLGYLFAALGPVLAGILAQSNGSWRTPIAVVGILAALQVGVSFAVGRNPQKESPSPDLE